MSIYRVIAVPQLACFTSHGSPDLGPILAPMDMHALRAAFAASYPHTGVDGWHALQCVLGS